MDKQKSPSHPPSPRRSSGRIDVQGHPGQIRSRKDMFMNGKGASHATSKHHLSRAGGNTICDAPHAPCSQMS